MKGPKEWMRATVIMSGLSKDRVIDSVEIATSHHAEAKRAIKPVKDYEVDNVSKKDPSYYCFIY